MYLMVEVKKNKGIIECNRIILMDLIGALNTGYLMQSRIM